MIIPASQPMKCIVSDSQVISLSNDTNTSLVPASEMWRLHIFLRHTSTDNLSSDFRLFGSQNIAFQESTLRLIGMSLFSKMFCHEPNKFQFRPALCAMWKVRESSEWFQSIPEENVIVYAVIYEIFHPSSATHPVAVYSISLKTTVWMC